MIALLESSQSWLYRLTNNDGGHVKSKPENSSSGIKRLCKKGNLKEAIHILHKPESKGSFHAFLFLLQGCTKNLNMVQGKLVHAHIVHSSFMPNILMWNTILFLYAKGATLADVLEIFHHIDNGNVYTWTIVIEAYMEHRYSREALELFYHMQQGGLIPDKVLFLSVVTACTSLSAFEEGKRMHNQIILSGLDSDINIRNTLVHMYSKCGSIWDARQVFDRINTEDIVSWNVIIGGYAHHGDVKEALVLFAKMKWLGLMPDKVTFLNSLAACVNTKALAEGKWLNACIIISMYHPDISVQSALVDMYAKCGSLEDACLVFDRMVLQNVVSWNALIAGYSEHKHDKENFKIFGEMLQPDKVTFLTILNACANDALIEYGKWIHAHVLIAGLRFNVHIGNATIDMYARCDRMNSAQEVFDRMAVLDLISWNTLIAGYMKHDDQGEALIIFNRMQQEGFGADAVTFSSILSTCAKLTALEQGKHVHAKLMKSGSVSNECVSCALIGMYLKCGKLKDACQVFDRNPERDTVSWTMMVAGFAQHGYGQEALQIFRQMQGEGMKADGITIATLLSGCSHAGLVDEGSQYLDLMAGAYGITPTNFHYACMIDAFGRAGLLEEAGELMRAMPFEPNILGSTSFLGACIIHGKMESAK